MIKDKIVPGFKFFMPDIDFINTKLGLGWGIDKYEQWGNQWHTVISVATNRFGNLSVNTVTETGYEDSNAFNMIVAIVTEYKHPVPRNYKGDVTKVRRKKPRIDPELNSPVYLEDEYDFLDDDYS